MKNLFQPGLQFMAILFSFFILNGLSFADVYPEPEKCRDEEALNADPTLSSECFPVMFLKPEAQHNATFKSFQADYFQRHGYNLDSNVLLNGALGFFIDAQRKVFISAIHPYEGCVEVQLGGSWEGEYLVSESNPPINCGEVELLFIGRDLMTTNWSLDPYLNLDLVKEKKRIWGCFDCVPVSQNADIVVGRVVNDQLMPKNPRSVEIAKTLPSESGATFLLGVPEVLKETRFSLGNMKGNLGNAIIASNFALPGFSGGPLLNDRSEAIGVAVTKTSHIDRTKAKYELFEHSSGVLNLWKEMGISIAYPSGWHRSWTISVSLGQFEEQIKAALKHAEMN